MACNCGRNKPQITSVNVSDNSGEPTIGARDAARARAEAMVAAARNLTKTSQDSVSTE